MGIFDGVYLSVFDGIEMLITGRSTLKADDGSVLGRYLGNVDDGVKDSNALFIDDGILASKALILCTYCAYDDVQPPQRF